MNKRTTLLGLALALVISATMMPLQSITAQTLPAPTQLEVRQDVKDHIYTQCEKWSKGEITGKFKALPAANVAASLTVYQAYHVAQYVVGCFGESACNWWLESYGLDWTWLQLAYSNGDTWQWPVESLAPGNYLAIERRCYIMAKSYIKTKACYIAYLTMTTLRPVKV